jgi:hypothetical protein
MSAAEEIHQWAAQTIQLAVASQRAPPSLGNLRSVEIGEGDSHVRRTQPQGD